MGYRRFTGETYTASYSAYVPTRGPATARAERQAITTGKLHELVDPAGYGVIRPSRMRFEERPDGLFTVTIGCPVTVEGRLDTTGSMGGNVDIALRELEKLYLFTQGLVPDCDLQLALGIFGDVQDRFVLCRPQFEMEAEKIVQQLTLMVPERDGGDMAEDPHYGLFGAAYLTDAYVNKISLKRYDFTISDAPARDRLNPKQLTRIFGDQVFDRAAENGFNLSPGQIIDTQFVVDDLLKQAHAFFLQVGNDDYTNRFWTDLFGPERVVVLPHVRLLPQVQAVIIGLTEGTLNLQDAESYLAKHGVSKDDSRAIVRSVANIPLEAQAALPNFGRKPKAGDVFRSKTDLWPMDPSEVPALPEQPSDSGEIVWGEDGQL